MSIIGETVTWGDDSNPVTATVLHVGSAIAIPTSTLQQQAMLTFPLLVKLQDGTLATRLSHETRIHGVSVL